MIAYDRDPMTTSEPASPSASWRKSRWAVALPPADLQAVANDVWERSFPAGAVVAAKGQPSEHWIGVLEGMVKVDTIRADGRSTTFIGVSSGGWLGEGAVLKGELRPYDVVALQDTRIAFLPRASFLWLYENSLAFNHFLISQLNARLAQFILSVERSRIHTTAEQIAFGLASLLDPILNPAAGSRVRISHEEIGKLCGVSRQVAAKGLHSLEQAGIIRLEYNVIEIKDAAALRAAAGLVATPA